MTAYEQSCPGCKGIAHKNWRCFMCDGGLTMSGNGSASVGGGGLAGLPRRKLGRGGYKITDAEALPPHPED